jgi:hypothetical protein
LALGAGDRQVNPCHRFGGNEITRSGVLVATCRHCGARRRTVIAPRADATSRVEFLFALPGRTEWTDRNPECTRTGNPVVRPLSSRPRRERVPRRISPVFGGR